MARMTGVVPALYQNFMQTLDRKRAMQQEALERERQNVELQSMFKSMGFEAPPSMTRDTAPLYLNELQTKRAEAAQQKRMETQTQAKANEKALIKLENEKKKSDELTADISALYQYYGNYIQKLALPPITTKAQYDNAKEMINESILRERTEFNNQIQTKYNVDQWGQTRPTSKLPSVPQLIYNQRMLARKYYRYIKEKEYGVDYTKPDNVYYALPPEIQDQWDAETGGAGTPPPQPGGGKPLFMEPGFLPPTPNITGTQITPMQSSPGIIPAGARLEPDKRTLDGRPVYKLPNGQYWTP